VVEQRDGIRRGVGRYVRHLGGTRGWHARRSRSSWGGIYHPNGLYRTAGDVTRTHGGVGGREGRPSLLPN
jgi:hypothetical protein